MNTGKIKEQVLQPKILAGIAIALMIGIFGTQYAMQNYVVDSPPFNQTEVINEGVKIASNSTHSLYAKCQGNYTASNITESNINSTWVVENCWFTSQKRNLNQSEGLQLGGL